MNELGILAALIAVATVVEFVFPGRPVYQYGWYNVLVAALLVVGLMRLRPALKRRPEPRTRTALWIATAGTIALVFAIVACGLLAPEPRVVIGAPGSRIHVDDLGGDIAFPLANDDGAARIEHPRGNGSFVIRTFPRTVVSVDAYDERGSHLTVTQPTGTAFLSPVLMMTQVQPIAGVTVPYDAFALPAIHRSVNAVLYSAAQAAALHFPGEGAAVVMDVKDASGTDVPHGIGLARDGEPASIAGITFKVHVFSYPAVRVVPVPNLYVCAAGLAALLIGVFLLVSGTRRLTASPAAG